MSSKVVLVTGANQGLGFETIHVTALRDPSATYLLGSRNLESGYDSVKRLKDLGVKAEIEVLQLDVTNDEQIEAAVDTVQKKYGKLDVLVNNAGIGFIGRKPDVTLSDIRNTYNDVFNVNMTSVAVVTTAFLPLLHAAKSPKVINITSGLGSMTINLKKKIGRSVPYGASKVGLNGLTVHMQIAENDRIEREEAEGKGKSEGRIRYFVVQPGLLKTAFTGFMPHAKDPKDGAEVVTRLALDDEGVYSGGTYWEFEGGEMREVPW